MTVFAQQYDPFGPDLVPVPEQRVVFQALTLPPAAGDDVGTGRVRSLPPGGVPANLVGRLDTKEVPGIALGIEIAGTMCLVDGVRFPVRAQQKIGSRLKVQTARRAAAVSAGIALLVGMEGVHPIGCPPELNVFCGLNPASPCHIEELVQYPTPVSRIWL